MSSSKITFLTGFIDFYFACTDWLAYDIAICLNAWCFDADGSFVPERGRALIQAYSSVRKLTDAELAALRSWLKALRCASC